MITTKNNDGSTTYEIITVTGSRTKVTVPAHVKESEPIIKQWADELERR
jgi:hypothetical protein